MSTYQQILDERRRTKARARLIEQYAAEKGISMQAAWHRIYRNRERLDPNGDLLPRARKDKGTTRRYSPMLIAQARDLLRSKELAVTAIARQLSVSKDFVWRVSHGLYRSA